MTIECHFVRAEKALASLHISTGLLSLRHCTKSLALPKMAICVLFMSAAIILVSLHICAGKVPGQCDICQDPFLAAKALQSLHVCRGSNKPLSQYLNIMCWLKEIFVMFM